jgi:DNA-binding IclR family transcriptional regulator
MTDQSPPSRTQAKSAGRALDILEALSQERSGLTFTDLINRLEFPKSSLHELLSLLNERRFIDIDSESRKYTLGIKVWEVGQAFVRHREIVDIAMDEMEKIVATINETVQLAILDRADNVYLAKVDCTHPLRIQTDVGKRFPSHATALGKVLLAHLPKDEAGRRLSGVTLTKMTPRTITDHDELMRVLGRTRSQAFGIDWEEGMDGLRCVAVPIRDHSGVVAAISTSVPVFRATNDQMADAVKLLANASLAISRSLGATEEDPGLVRLLATPDETLKAVYEQAERQPKQAVG